jgi:hypothetical protein
LGLVGRDQEKRLDARAPRHALLRHCHIALLQPPRLAPGGADLDDTRSVERFQQEANLRMLNLPPCARHHRRMHGQLAVGIAAAPSHHVYPLQIKLIPVQVTCSQTRKRGQGPSARPSFFHLNHRPDLRMHMLHKPLSSLSPSLSSLSLSPSLWSLPFSLACPPLFCGYHGGEVKGLQI